MTSCNVCPDGTWTYIKGSLHADDCTSCGRANDCSPGATARVTVMIEGLNFAGLSGSQQRALQKAYADKIAATSNLPSSESVWDLLGDNGTTTFTDGMIEAFVAVPHGSYANTLARALYASAFKEEMLQITVDGAPRASAVGPVVLKLEKFQRQVMTTTRTTTTITATDTATTSTTTEAAVETTKVHHDLIGTTAGALRGKNSANRGLSLRWCELLLAGFLVANLVN